MRDLGSGSAGCAARLAPAAEIVVAVGAATACVAALQSTAPAAGLGVLYLLAILWIAIRRGERSALVAAVLSIFTLNYLFIAPRHTLDIRHSQDVVELAVLMIAAVVVGRLAATGRQRGAEAEHRANLAAAREREAKLLADTASAILAGHSVAVQLDTIGTGIAQATGATDARVVLEPVPSPAAGELALPLRTRVRPAWLYVSH